MPLVPSDERGSPRPHGLAGVGVAGVGAGHLIFARVKPIPVLAGYGLSHGSCAITNQTYTTFNAHLHSRHYPCSLSKRDVRGLKMSGRGSRGGDAAATPIRYVMVHQFFPFYNLTNHKFSFLSVTVGILYHDERLPEA